MTQTNQSELTLIQDNATVTFQGDSITDAGWDRENDGNLGMGYAREVACWFEMLYPQKNVKFINRGSSGWRVKDMQAHWQTGCIDIKPDWVSILIGINDVWRRYDGADDPTSVEAYEESFRDLLTQTRDKLGAKLIILEPFLLPVSEEVAIMREDLDPKIQAARALAREFDAIYIPLDGLFAAQCMLAEPTYWASDGVHPTYAGHAFIAQQWMKAVGAM